VTVGRYYTVSGRSTQIEGVHTDIRVPTLYAPFNIGEKYLSYPLKNDQIESVFMDPLIDVTPRTRSWMQKNYLPYIQKKLSFWSESMNRLKSNSEQRLRNDKDFQRFLKAIQSEKKGAEIPEELFGEIDVQMAEAVRIVKDMVFLEQSKKNGLESRK
jgi:carboxyl-terminal processing protease